MKVELDSSLEEKLLNVLGVIKLGGPERETLDRAVKLIQAAVNAEKSNKVSFMNIFFRLNEEKSSDEIFAAVIEVFEGYLYEKLPSFDGPGAGVKISLLDLHDEESGDRIIVLLGHIKRTGAITLSFGRAVEVSAN